MEKKGDTTFTVDDIQHLFSELDQYNLQAERLPIQTEEFLKVIYGIPKTVPLGPDIIKPPNPEESVNLAESYLETQKKKGFLSSGKDLHLVNPYLRNRLFSSKKNNYGYQANQIDLPSLYKKEPELEFWMKLEVVKKSVEEISNLPYISSGDSGFAVSKLYDSASSIARSIMISEQQSKKSRTQKALSAHMTKFVLSIRETRFEIIKSLIERKKIDTEKLTICQKEEFIGTKNKESPTDQETTTFQIKSSSNPFAPSLNDNNMNQGPLAQIKALSKGKQLTPSEMNDALLIRISQNCSKLPPAYKVDDIHTDNETLAKQRNNQKRFLTAIVPRLKQVLDDTNHVETRPQSTHNEQTIEIKPKRAPPRIFAEESHANDKMKTTKGKEKRRKELSIDDINGTYWRIEDPLKEVRTGEKRDVFKDMYAIIDKFHFEAPVLTENDIDDPFPLESRKEKEREEAERIKKEEEKMAEIQKEKENISSTQNPAEGPNLVDNVWNTSDLTTPQNAQEKIQQPKMVYSERVSIDALKILNSHPISQSEESKKIHSDLESIWSKLGFTIQQKLALLLKYSKDSEESSKLKDSLVFWQHCYEALQLYDRAFANLKDFCHFEKESSKQSYQNANSLMREVKIQEDNLEQVAQVLKKQFGDDLIIRRKRYQDLIIKRDEKMQRWLSPYHITYPNYTPR